MQTNPRPKQISICGVARAGKDTLARLLDRRFKELSENNPETLIISLATPLKNELRANLLYTFGIDIWHCTPEEKEKVRPTIVNYSKEIRKNSKGSHFCKIIDDTPNISDYSLIIVPDVRHGEYEGTDEIYWAKNRGVVVHLSRIDKNGELVGPANDTEEFNDPIISNLSDYHIVWQSGDEDFLYEKYKPQLDWILLNAL